ncbi:YfgM family protein [Allohahella marinimesophila]|uniref:Ancillary SecYEG translocon subunit n=1 Tax=Allohahella marinimesophila TaxID=1054972 RepID=A0ABP7P4P1_9GAMM
MVDRSDDEQLDALKQWWRANGTSLIVGVILAIAAIFGFKAWQNNQLQEKAESSLKYQQLVEAAAADQQSAFLKAQQPQADGEASADAEADDADTARFLAKELKEATGIRGYELLADLYLSQSHFSASQLDEAHKQLVSALEQTESESLKRIIQARLARVEMAQENYEAAIARLEVPRDDVFYSYFQELRGDIYKMTEKPGAALEAYRNARDALAAKPPVVEQPLIVRAEGEAPDQPDEQQQAAAQALAWLDTKIADLGAPNE